MYVGMFERCLVFLVDRAAISCTPCIVFSASAYILTFHMADWKGDQRRLGWDAVRR